MRVAIDYTAAVHQGAGIGRYTRNLIRALSQLDGENGYTLFVAGGWGDGDGFGPWPENFRIRSVPLSDRWVHLLWQRTRLEGEPPAADYEREYVVRYTGAAPEDIHWALLRLTWSSIARWALAPARCASAP